MTHDEAADAAERHFNEGLERLRKSAELLRGPDIDPSPEAMRTEMALTRAIETLVGNGFRVPR